MRPAGNEIATVIDVFGKPFVERCHPNTYTLHTLDMLRQCRTAALGGHVDKCDSCGKKRISYDSCRNRHCPKCQAAKQAFWVEDRMLDALPVKYFHVVFTVPHELNEVCLEDSRWFYDALFECVWHTLQGFGYSHYGVGGGAICILHTWGQNLSLHPHIHCLVPAAGLTLKGSMKRIAKEGKYLYPVRMLSVVFRGKLLGKLKRKLSEKGLLSQYQPVIDILYQKPWVVHCEPPFGSPAHIVKYLGQYTHRVAISNQRILHIDNQGVTFRMKDYTDNGKQKTIRLDGVEFLRRFCMHFLPKRFVRIRHYGILSSKVKRTIKPVSKDQKTVAKETVQQRFLRLTGHDVCQCPFCKKGKMKVVEALPKIRSPGLLQFATKLYQTACL